MKPSILLLETIAPAADRLLREHAEVIFVAAQELKVDQVAQNSASKMKFNAAIDKKNDMNPNTSATCIHAKLSS